MIHIWGGKKKQKMHDLFSFFPPVHYGHTYSKSSQHTLKPWNSLRGVQWQRVCLEVRKLRLHEIKLPPAQKTTYQAAITSQKYIWSHIISINEAVCQVDVKKKEGRRREKLSEYFTDTSTPKLFWRWLPRLSDTSESAEAVWKLQSVRACLERTFLTNSKWHRWQPLFASPSVSGPRELASSCSEPVVQLRCNASAAHYVKSRHFFFSWQWVG